MWIGVAVLLALAAYASGELVYLEDLNNDHLQRNLDFGLPETLNFNLRHSAGSLELKLKENRRLNANAPIYVARNGKAVLADVAPNPRVRFYQDLSNGAHVVGACESDPHGPCTRKLTGNLHIAGEEYKLEPATADKRSFSAHLGAAHYLEKLEKKTYQARTVGNMVVSSTGDIDDAIPHAEAEHSVLAEDDAALMEKKAALLGDLMERLERLKSIKKRQAGPVDHGIEMIIAVDHYVYNMFDNLYTGQELILTKLREYMSHIVNGADLRYAAIEESDVAFVMTIAGFFIAETEEESTVWMDYSEGKPDGLDALINMRSWRKTAGLPDHDHVALITGTDFYYSNSRGVVGLAYLNGVCNDYRVSISEEYGFFEGAGVLAHELGHNLGAPHDDGATNGPCDPSRQFVMAPYVASVGTGSSNTEPWLFSECSVQSFRDYVNGMGDGSCTLNTPEIYDEDEFNDFTDNLGGAEYTEDEQCELLLGDNAVMCDSNKNTADVCRNFRCQTSGSSCTRFVPAAGTPCGTDKMCFNGVCQAKECKGRQCDSDGGETTTALPGTTTIPDNSFFCYDAGLAGFSCSELKSLVGTEKSMCSKFARDCCETCSTKANCKKEKPVKLGGKKKSCKSLVEEYGYDTTCFLFTKECCKTCGPQ